METKLIKIGNSKGVRLPKQLISDYDDHTSFDAKRDGDALILTPKKNKRVDWINQMKKVKKEDSNFVLNDFDQNEWEW